MSIMLQVRSRGRPVRGLPGSAELKSNDNTAELYRSIAAQAKCNVYRLRITQDNAGKVPVASSRDLSLEQAGLLDQSTIYVKDLGAQVSWQTVFIVEYLGPIFIHLLIYFLRPHIYRDASSQPSELQTISLIMITAHFLKRELETMLLHRFSNASMPVFNIFKNSGHYWGLAGLLIAYVTYAPNSTTAAPSNPVLTYTAIALYLISELANLNAHLCLRRLRSEGSAERGIPRGLGFNLVTCPNYMFEIFAWIAITMVNRSWSTLIFMGVAIIQMVLWARKKEFRLRKEFGDKYKKKRYTMLPGIC